MNVGLGQQGNFYERGSEMLPLEDDKRKGEGDSPEKGWKHHLLSDKRALQINMWHITLRKTHIRDKYLGSKFNGVMAECKSETTRKMPWKYTWARILKKSLRVSYLQLCIIHGTLSSRHFLWIQSHTEMKQRSFAPSVGGDNCLNSSQLCFLDSSAQQMLEAHITKFNLRMVWCLPWIIGALKWKLFSHITCFSPILCPQTTWFLRWTQDVLEEKLGSKFPKTLSQEA